jgi:hypothetical protein
MDRTTREIAPFMDFPPVVLAFLLCTALGNSAAGSDFVSVDALSAGWTMCETESTACSMLTRNLLQWFCDIQIGE